MTWSPAPASAGTWFRQSRPESGKPCSSTTGRPWPVTWYSIPIPLTFTRLMPLGSPGPVRGSSAVAGRSGPGVHRHQEPRSCEAQQVPPQDHRHEELAVAVLVEQHRDLVAVITLHRALPPALAHHARAHGERDIGGRDIGVREV